METYEAAPPRLLAPGRLFDTDAYARGLRLSFRDGVRTSAECLTFRGHRLPFPSGHDGVARAASLLAGHGLTEDDLARDVPVAELHAALEHWDGLGLLRRELYAGDRALVGAHPMAPGVTGAPRPAGTARLSRFAFLRRDDGPLVLESPLSPVRMAVYEPGVAAALAVLADPMDAAALAAAQPPGTALADPDTAGALLDLLDLCGYTDREPAADWEFHDLLFHTRSRLGRHDHPVGGTFHHDDREPLPAFPPHREGPVVDLPRPGPARLITPFAQVLEERRSVRRHGPTPIGLGQLAEFLHHVFEVRARVPRDDARGIPYDTTERPYPSGGGAYDLETYILAHRCEGLAAGAYHYAAGEHRLVRVGGPGRRLDAALGLAASAAGMDGPPHTLIVLTSRLGRLTWKYQGMAYATTLKNTGVVYQTMYLVATAMGLAPCAVGTGDSALLARLLGADPLAEPVVGEFLLGNP